MAHFAELDENGAVLRVIVVGNADITTDEKGSESEAKGIAFCQALFGEKTRWAQTSYNGNLRKNYAGPGYVYDEKLDAFVPPQPDEEHVLDEKTAQWVKPLEVF